MFNFIQSKNYPESSLKLEHEFAEAINDQIITGFPFDVEKALDLVDTLRQRQEELEEELQKAFPPITEESVFTPKVNNKKRGYVAGVPFTKQIENKFNDYELLYKRSRMN